MARSWIATAAIASFFSVSVLASSSAMAQGLKDDYRPEGFSWTGFYLGGHAGLATGKTSGEVDFGGSGISTDYDMNGGLWGAHIGYNYQVGHTVLGIEGTWSGLNASGSESCVIVLDCGRKVDWLATVVGRVGYAMDRAMVYGLAGVAWGDVETKVTSSLGGGGFGLNGDATHVGWVVGAGIEYAISPRVSARVEYNHVDLGSKTHELSFDGSPGPTLPSKVDASLDTIKLGVSFKLN